MFSKRIPAQLAPNRLARHRLSLDADALIDLTVSNPARAALALPEGAILEALGGGSLAHDPDPRGWLPAREAVCRYYAEAHGAAVHPDDVFLTACTSEAYGFLFKLLADPGDGVLVPSPSYPLFDHLIQLEGLAARAYPLWYHGRWQLDLAAVEDRLGGARALVVVSPNNPTGSYLGRDELAALEAALLPRSIPIISDEVFADYPLRPRDPDRVATLAGRGEGILGFSLGGLSKLLALPHLKLSWIALSGDAQLRAQARAGLELIADTYLTVGAPVQRALPALMELRTQIGEVVGARVRANLAALHRHAGPPSPLGVLDAEGGWSAVLRVPRVMDDDDGCIDLADHAGVWVHPGYFFDLPPGHAVVSLLPPPAAFEDGAARIARRVQAW